MLSILLGPDSYTKHEFVQRKSLDLGVSLELLTMPEDLPMGELSSQDLFAKKKMFVISGAIGLLDDAKVQKLQTSPHYIYFLDDKIDKRTSFGKSLISHKSLEIQEFALPHGRELNTWIQKRTKELGGDIENGAIEQLAVLLGRDEGDEVKFGGKIVSVEEIFTLWEVDQEIKKLISFTDGKKITEHDVRMVVSERGEAKSLDIVNAIAEKQKDRVMVLLEKFLRQENASDEKGKIIQLNALLSEQFRNIAMIQNFIQQQVPEDQILSQTKWKSGRLFVIKKIASRFEQKKVMETLAKLSALDEELKTGSVPPRVLLDLILVQLF